MAEYGLKSTTLARLRQSEKIVTLLLLFILLTAATTGVTSVLIGPDWGSLWRGLTLGLLIGWVLAIFRQPAWRTVLIVPVTGAAYALLFAGGLRERISTIFSELAFIASQTAASPRNPGFEWATLGQLVQELFGATGVVLERVRIWVMALVAGEPAFDPVAAALVWSMMIWIIAAWAGWIVEAWRSALLAGLPALMLSLGVLSYGRLESAAIYFMLASILLLLATVQLDCNRQRWEREEVAYPPRKGRQIAGTATIVVVALVALSAITSSISLPHLVEWITEQTVTEAQQEGSLAKSLGIRAAATTSPDIFEDVRRPGLPRELLIGSGPELSQRKVMTVEIEDYLSIFKGEQPWPLYWRSFTYDVYTNHGWQTSNTSLSEYQSNQPLQPAQMPYHILLKQTVRSVGGEMSILYAAGEPVVVNQPSDAAWRSIGDLFGIQINSSAGYVVSSLLPIVDEGKLRAAGQSYPGWVKQHFLYLPSEVPARVTDLAFQLTAAEPTPYDRAKAIERYLRTIPYTLDVPYPPVDQDLVDYFLFDLRKGYCDYYASAMVVLARAAGIPSRLSIGFANGTYDLNSKRYQVTEADAHSWVEIYFPNIGWVAFEPTAARPVPDISQSSGSSDVQEVTANEDILSANHPGITIDERMILLGGLLAVSMLGLILIVTDEVRLRRLAEPRAASEVYRRMRHYGARLAIDMGTGDTPYEFAASLGSRIQELILRRNMPALPGHLIAEVNVLIDGIVLASYHPSPARVKSEKTVYIQWRKLRWRLRLMWLMMYYNSLRDRVSKILTQRIRDMRAEAEQEA